jgi:hypothetical protein
MFSNIIIQHLTGFQRKGLGLELFISKFVDFKAFIANAKKDAVEIEVGGFTPTILKPMGLSISVSKMPPSFRWMPAPCCIV